MRKTLFRLFVVLTVFSCGAHVSNADAPDYSKVDFSTVIGTVEKFEKNYLTISFTEVVKTGPHFFLSNPDPDPHPAPLQPSGPTLSGEFSRRNPPRISEKIMVLKVSDASTFHLVVSGNGSGNSVVTQESAKASDFIAGQTIAVVYLATSEGNILLSAVAKKLRPTVSPTFILWDEMPVLKSIDPPLTNREAVIARAKLDESNAIEQIELLGGKVEALNARDELTCFNVSFSGCAIKDMDLKELRKLKNLTRLSLSGTRITDAGLVELNQLKSLTMLDLSDTQITDRGIRELGEPKKLIALEIVSTTEDSVLNDFNELKNLTELNLSGTKITNAGLQELSKLKSLTTLTLSGTQITDAGVKELIKIKKLSMLDISDTKITNLGLRFLMNVHIDGNVVTTFDLTSRSLTLNLCGTQTTDAGVERLKESQPNMRIIRFAGFRVPSAFGGL